MSAARRKSADVESPLPFAVNGCSWPNSSVQRPLDSALPRFHRASGVVRSEWAQCSDVAGIRTQPAYLGGAALYQPDGGRAAAPQI